MIAFYKKRIPLKTFTWKKIFRAEVISELQKTINGGKKSHTWKLIPWENIKSENQTPPLNIDNMKVQAFSNEQKVHLDTV